ncbi:hypothetical protein K488DRAFT_92755, partial [Vararia minispora EC-137]
MKEVSGGSKREERKSRRGYLRVPAPDVAERQVASSARASRAAAASRLVTREPTTRLLLRPATTLPLLPPSPTSTLSKFDGTPRVWEVPFAWRARRLLKPIKRLLALSPDRPPSTCVRGAVTRSPSLSLSTSGVPVTRAPSFSSPDPPFSSPHLLTQTLSRRCPARLARSPSAPSSSSSGVSPRSLAVQAYRFWFGRPARRPARPPSAPSSSSSPISPRSPAVRASCSLALRPASSSSGVLPRSLAVRAYRFWFGHPSRRPARPPSAPSFSSSPVSPRSPAVRASCSLALRPASSSSPVSPRSPAVRASRSPARPPSAPSSGRLQFGRIDLRSPALRPAVLLIPRLAPSRLPFGRISFLSGVPLARPRPAVLLVRRLARLPFGRIAFLPRLP